MKMMPQELDFKSPLHGRLKMQSLTVSLAPYHTIAVGRAAWIRPPGIRLGEEHRRVSRRHCYFRRDDDNLFVLDGDPGNGTWVGGRRCPVFRWVPAPWGEPIYLGKPDNPALRLLAQKADGL